MKPHSYAIAWRYIYLALFVVSPGYLYPAAAQDNSTIAAYKERYQSYQTQKRSSLPVGLQLEGSNKFFHQLENAAWGPNHSFDGGTDTESFTTNVDVPHKVQIHLAGDTPEVAAVVLESVESWKQRRNDLGPTMATKGVDEAMAKVEVEFNHLIDAPADKRVEESFEASLREVENELVKSYQEGIGAPEELELICKQLGDIRRERLKARYGREDNYRPEIYDLIYRNSRSICAIVRTGDFRPLGTGVMIGDDLILTCLHNFTKSGLNPSQCEAWFNYETTSAIPAPQPDIFPLGEFVCAGGKIGPLDVLLDFALIQLRPATDGARVRTLMQDGKLKYPLPTLDDRPLVRDDAVYVIGHPAGAMRMVHDNAFVLFPFRTNQHGYDALRMIVCAETQESPQQGKELKQFLDSFIPLPPNPGESSIKYEQYSMRWYGMPVIAADCDTSHGNSGSPVFDRQTNGLVGLLFAGETDLAEDFSPGWRKHEAIIPIELVVQQAEVQRPNWRTEFKVTLR